MSKPTILVVGNARQTQVAHQINTLMRLNAQVISLDPYGNQGVYGSLSWENESIVWKGIKLDANAIQGVWLCNHAPDMPTDDHFNNAPYGLLDWDGWYKAFALQRDRGDTLFSALLYLELCGVKIMNPPSKSNLSRRKPYQLQVLRQAGCPLPATLITNDVAAAAAFIEANGECIMKPAAGGALTLSANELLASGGLAELPNAAPAIFQKRALGSDVRVMVVGGKVISSAIINVPQGTMDFRGVEDYQAGHITYQEAPLPPAIEQTCVNAVQALGLNVGGIDLRLSPEGEYVMLECNSGPIYLDVEYKLGHPITERIAQELLKTN